MKKLFDEFMNPPVNYRGKPFWSWNGELDREELLRQIHIMKGMGFGGFFMHSRTGLKTQYLGEEWFHHINACAEEAEKLGMEAWLYDEDRWPSGIAGGMVTVNPEYRMKSIKLIVVRSGEFSWNNNILAVFACKLDEFSFYDCNRINIHTPKEDYEGKDILVFSVIEMACHNFYNGFTYVDTLNKKATEKFLELTHEKYKEKCGDRLGTSIKGIFTDEPHRGTIMSEFGAGNEEDIWRAPWTKLLPEEFIKKYGYDLIEKLPELFLKRNGELVSQVKWHYVELLQEMFLNNFAKPINEWCTKNNIIITGHILHEDSLTAQTAMSGSVMRYYEYLDYPGVDVLTEGNKSYWIVKQLASVARQLGKKTLLSELYGCTGWQTNFESHKAIGDWQALFGINLRCHHLSWYTMEGEAKRDYPASILHQSTWWKEYKYVEDYFSRIGLLMSNGSACCEVLVLNPVESVWCQVFPGYAKMLDGKAEEVVKLEDTYKNIFHWLQGAHIDFDYGDEDILSRYYSIEYDELCVPLLRIGHGVYRVIVIAGMLTIRSSTMKILREFINSGGKVIFAGNPPDYIDAVPGVEAIKLSQKAITLALTKESLIHAVKDNTEYDINIMDEDGANIEDIYCQLRKDGEAWQLMLLNVNREKTFKKVRIELKLQGNVEEWVCTTGERFIIENFNQEGYTKFETSFEPCKEHLYYITAKETDDIPNKAILTEKASYSITGPYDYDLDEPNVCVLDMAKYKIDDEEWSSELEILKVDRAVRDKLKLAFRGGEMLQPWFNKNNNIKVGSKLALEFEFFIQDIPENMLQLVMEKPEEFLITINGNTLKTPIMEGFWIDKCFKKLEILKEFLKVGKNSIKLEVDFHEGINLEAIFIIGEFGVYVNGIKKVLKKLPDKIYAQDLTEQGFPFYSGKICYNLILDKNVKADERVFLCVGSFEGACVKYITDYDYDYEKIIGWEPYEVEITNDFHGRKLIKLEVVLTRRNTFGPLHQLPLKVNGCGPENYLTEGEAFTNDYMRIPSGLLKEPYISIRD